MRVRGERGLEVRHDGQRLELDLDEGRRLACDLGRHRRDAGDDVALEADGVPREQPPVLDHAAVEHVGHVLVCHDGDHPGSARAFAVSIRVMRACGWSA